MASAIVPTQNIRMCPASVTQCHPDSRPTAVEGLRSCNQPTETQNSFSLVVSFASYVCAAPSLSAETGHLRARVC